MANIQSVKVGSSTYTVATPYCTCETEAATAAKTASLANFSLASGTSVKVKFTYANSAANPTLNINSTGDVAIKGYGTAAPTLSWAAGSVIEFTYDGTNYIMSNYGALATGSHYGQVSTHTVSNPTASLKQTGGSVTATDTATDYSIIVGKNGQTAGTSTAKATAKISTAGVITSDSSESSASTQSIGTNVTAKTFYLPSAVLSAAASSIIGSSFTPSLTYNSSTGKYDFSGAGSVTGTAYAESAVDGYVTNQTASQSLEASVVATGSVNTVSLTSSLSGATSARTPSISRQAISISGVTDAASGAATTTAPTTGYYVAAQSAANTGTITANPSVKTAGYGDTSHYGVNAPATATVGAATSAMTYIPITAGTTSKTDGTASATANAGTASVTTNPSASASASQTGMTDGVSTTATSYYFTSSASANSGKLTATGGSARAYVTASTVSVTAGYTNGVSAGTSASDTGTKTGNTATCGDKTASDSSTIYLKAAGISVSGGGLSQSGNSGGGLSGGDLSGGGLTAGSGEVSLSAGSGAADAGGTNIDLGSKTTTKPTSGYYIQVNGSGSVSGQGRGSVTRATINRAAVTRAAFSNTVTRAAVTDTRTAGYLPARSATTIVSSGTSTVSLAAGTLAAGSIASTSGTSNWSSSSSLSSNTYTAYYPVATAAISIGGGGLTQSGNSGGGLSGGGLSAGSGSASVTTTPVVTPSIGGTVVSTGTSTYGVTTTKPSGTDGTNFLTLDPGGSVTTSGVARGSGTVSRAAVTRAAFSNTVTRAAVTDTRTAGWLATRAATTILGSGSSTVSLAADSTTIGATSLSSNAATCTITPSVGAGTNYYVPIVTASASASNGTASIAKQPSASTTASSATVTATGFTASSTATSYYVTASATSGSATAKSGYSTATGGSASASVGKGITAGASKSASGTTATSTEVTSSQSAKTASATVYIPAGGCTVAGGGLSQGTASGGGLSGGDISGGGLSGGGLSAGSGEVSLTAGSGEVSLTAGSGAADASGSNIDLGSKTTTKPTSGYYIQVNGSGTVTGIGRGSVSGQGRGSVSRATITRAAITRAAVTRATFSQAVTRAAVTDTHTAGYIPAKSATTVISAGTSTVSLAAGTLSAATSAATTSAATSATSNWSSASSATSNWSSSSSKTSNTYTAYYPVTSGVITNNTSGGTSSGTINRGSQIKISKGYYGSDYYYTAQSNSGTYTFTGSGTATVNGYYYAKVAAGSINSNVSTTSTTSYLPLVSTSGWVTKNYMSAITIPSGTSFNSFKMNNNKVLTYQATNTGTLPGLYVKASAASSLYVTAWPSMSGASYPSRVVVGTSYNSGAGWGGLGVGGGAVLLIKNATSSDKTFTLGYNVFGISADGTEEALGAATDFLGPITLPAYYTAVARAYRSSTTTLNIFVEVTTTP